MSVMAMGVGFVFIIPRLLLGAIALFYMLKGKNCGRILTLILIAVSLCGAFQEVSITLMVSGPKGLLYWAIYQGIVPVLYLIAGTLLLSKDAGDWFNDPDASPSSSVAYRGLDRNRRSASSPHEQLSAGIPLSAQSTPPALSVQIALYILVALLLIKTTVTIIELASAPGAGVGDPSVAWLKPWALLFEVGLGLIVLVPQAVLVYMIYRRRLWAAGLQIAFIVVSSILILRTVITKGIGSSISSYLGLAMSVAAVTSVVLLLSPPSMRWFRRASLEGRA